MLSYDGLELFLTATRADTLGKHHIFVLQRPDLSRDFAGDPILLEGVQSQQEDVNAALGVDTRTLYLNYQTSLTGGGTADIWVSHRICP